MNARSSCEVSVREVQAMLAGGEEIVLVDVRQPDEYAICRIDGAWLLPLPNLQERVEELRERAAARCVVTYCHHGVRSLEAVAILRRGGLDRVRSMAGGIDAWAEEVDPGMARY